MKLSELQALLSKAQTAVGDADVILKDAETAAETVVTDLTFKLDAATGAPGGTVVVGHNVSPPAPTVEDTAPAAPTE